MSFVITHVIFYSKSALLWHYIYVISYNYLSQKFFIPITFLYMQLLYVDSIACPGITVEPTVSAIEFWSMEMLRLRETLEIKNGGFGLGGFKRMSGDINHSDKVLVEAKEDLEKNHDFFVRCNSQNFINYM